MIFGDPKEFAIEAYHEPSGPKWGGYGRFCLHIGGVAVGDIRDSHCSLFDITNRFRSVSGVITQLWAECFVGLSDAEIFRLIDHYIYIDDPPLDLETGLGECDFLTNSAEMFNGTKTFIFCTPDGVVHLLYRLRDDTFGSGCCNVEEFKSISDAYVRWFDEQVRNTAPPYFPINPFNLDEKVPDDFKS
jgi:hypothetical protein